LAGIIPGQPEKEVLVAMAEDLGIGGFRDWGIEELGDL
jgi:hypothetical protein